MSLPSSFIYFCLYPVPSSHPSFIILFYVSPIPIDLFLSLSSTFQPSFIPHSVLCLSHPHLSIFVFIQYLPAIFHSSFCFMSLPSPFIYFCLYPVPSSHLSFLILFYVSPILIYLFLSLSSTFQPSFIPHSVLCLSHPHLSISVFIQYLPAILFKLDMLTRVWLFLRCP